MIVFELSIHKNLYKTQPKSEGTAVGDFKLGRERKDASGNDRRCDPLTPVFSVIDMLRNILHNNRRSSQMHSSCTVPFTTQRLPLQPIADLVDGLAFTFPDKRERVVVVTEGDEVRCDTLAGGRNSADDGFKPVWIVGSREEVEDSRTFGEDDELLAGGEDGRHD